MAVPAQDHPSPKIVFVTDFPRGDDVLNNRILSGPDGKIFNAILRVANMDRNDYAITHVFDERPPKEDIGSWCVSLTSTRELGMVERPPIGSSGYLLPAYDHHLARLAWELERWRAPTIVPLGGTALWSLTGNSSITSVRGTITSAAALVPGAKLLPTFHPLAVQHQWKWFPIMVTDLHKAVREAERGPSIHYTHRELALEPSLDDIRDYIPRLMVSKLLSVDIETRRGQITCISLAPDPEHALVIPFVDRRRVGLSYWENPADEAQAWRMIEYVLSSPIPKVGQNAGSYDFYWLLKSRHIGMRNYRHDTRLLHHAIYPELPKDLGFLGANYATQGAWKHWAKNSEKEKRDD